eukprot:768550-Hanusia_phi.AAC.1
MERWWGLSPKQRQADTAERGWAYWKTSSVADRVRVKGGQFLISDKQGKLVTFAWVRLPAMGGVGPRIEGHDDQGVVRGSSSRGQRCGGGGSGSDTFHP